VASDPHVSLEKETQGTLGLGTNSHQHYKGNWLSMVRILFLKKLLKLGPKLFKGSFLSSFLPSSLPPSLPPYHLLSFFLPFFLSFFLMNLGIKIVLMS
jgi:hypothetical protein